MGVIESMIWLGGRVLPKYTLDSKEILLGNSTEKYATVPGTHRASGIAAANEARRFWKCENFPGWYPARITRVKIGAQVFPYYTPSSFPYAHRMRIQ